MDIKNIIEERHSVRKYTNKKIECNVKEELEKIIEECNKEGNLNIKMFLDEPKVFDTFMAHYGKFENVNNYIVLIGNKSKELEEKCGYYGEKIVLKAQELGLNTCWVGSTYGKNKIKQDLDKNEIIVITISIGYGKTQGIQHNSKSFDEVVKTDKEPPVWFKTGVEYALLAPTAVNQQKFIFELKDNKVKAIAKLGFFSKVDLGIVKYHFELGAGKENFEWIK